MKRFIDIGHQVCLDDSETKQFAFYCTVVDSFESFSGENLWETASDFRKDYLEHGGTKLERYLSLIPEEFK